MQEDSRATVCDALTGGEAVVVANPAPMSYGVVATTARAVNAVKGRPLDQNVGISLHDRSMWRELVPALDLPPMVLDPVIALLRMRLTVLLPVGGAVPPPSWAGPATRDGQVAVFNGYWAQLGWLWRRFPRLYGSSANRTGAPPASSGAEADAMFAPDTAIADVPVAEHTGRRWSSAMIRVDSAGRISLHRSGAQDRVSGLSSSDFMRELAGSVGLRPSASGEDEVPK